MIISGLEAPKGKFQNHEGSVLLSKTPIFDVRRGVELRYITSNFYAYKAKLWAFKAVKGIQMQRSPRNIFSQIQRLSANICDQSSLLQNLIKLLQCNTIINNTAQQ